MEEVDSQEPTAVIQDHRGRRAPAQKDAQHRLKSGQGQGQDSASWW